MTTDSPWPDLAGRFDGDTHVLPVRVYFEDTDFSGVVYHGAFIRFLERGRSDFVRLKGVGHDGLARGEHGEPLSFAVRRLKIDYHRPGRIDDVLEVRSRVIRVTVARIVLEQKVVLGDVALAVAEVEVVLLDGAGRPRRFPDSVLGALGGLRQA